MFLSEKLNEKALISLGCRAGYSIGEEKTSESFRITRKDFKRIEISPEIKVSFLL